MGASRTAGWTAGLCLAFSVAGAPLPALPAQVRQEPALAEGMRACLAIPKRKRRLACFEQLARATIARTDDRTNGSSVRTSGAGGAPSGSAAPAAVASNHHTGMQGRDGVKQGRSDEVRRFEIIITGVWPDARGHWNFETADGRVWRQRDESRIRLTRLPVEARVEKSLFGSYFLNIMGVPSDVRVERHK